MRKFFPIWILTPALFGCGTTTGGPLSCEGTDWFEIGRQKGRSAEPTGDLSDIKNACKGEQGLDQQNVAIFQTGYQQGLAEYCSPSNGFEMGRLQLPRPNLCPQSLKNSFQEAYDRGLRFAEIDLINRKSKSKLRSLNEDLLDPQISLGQRALREGQKIELEKKIQAEKEKLSDLRESSEVSGLSLPNASGTAPAN